MSTGERLAHGASGVHRESGKQALPALVEEVWILPSSSSLSDGGGDITLLSRSPRLAGRPVPVSREPCLDGV